jgi:hypothetical protein
VFIGVLSTAIPILTGVGYLTLTSMSTISFFVFYAISLSILVIALAKCVHLLAPKWFSCVDVGEILRKNDGETVSFNIFQVAATWEDCIKDNIRQVNALYSGLKLTVRLTIIGLIGLILAFLSLGTEYYLITYLTQTDPYKNFLSPNEWRALFLGISLLIFSIIITYILKNNGNKNEKNSKSLSNSVSDNQKTLQTGDPIAPERIEEIIKKLEDSQISSERNRILT